MVAGELLLNNRARREGISTMKMALLRSAEILNNSKNIFLKKGEGVSIRRILIGEGICIFFLKQQKLATDT